MRMVFLAVLIVTLAYAVGGGGGGSSGGSGGSENLDYQVTASVACPANELTVRAAADGKPLDGMVIQVRQDGWIIRTGATGSSGEIRFTLSQSDNYVIVSDRSGYKRKETTVNIQLCRDATGASAPPETVFCQETTRRERLRCRLHLNSTYVQRVNYLPEECTDLDRAARQLCVERYRTFQTCRNLETDSERQACIQPKLNISPTVHAVIAACRQKLGTSKALCMQQVKENVYSLVKFRMYNLEYKAEEFSKAGVSEEDTLDIMTKIAEAKGAFNRGLTLDEKKQAIRQLQDDWKAFLVKARSQLEASQ